MAHGGADTKKVVVAALTGNLVIAIAKFGAAYLSGSITMLAEGVHSFADTANQGLLLVGMALSLLLFFLGGVFAIVEGLEKLKAGPVEHGSPIAPIIVLVVSIFAEGGSFFVAFREFNKSRKGAPVAKAIFGGKDPTIPLVLLEDTGAMLGLAVALVAVILSWVTKSSAIDAIGSIVIGVLLCGIGLLLAKDTHSLLIGEGISDERRVEVVEIAQKIDGIEDVSQVLSLHLGPSDVLLALKVRFIPTLSLLEVERLTNTLEEHLREAHPELKRIFVEPDSGYDPTKDSEYSIVPRPKQRSS